MLSDEEREALQYFNTETRTEEMHYGAVLVKLIEKQSKEIEELKFKYQARKDRLQKEIEELNKSDASKEQSSMNYYNLYKELVDKIKAKIEEVDYKMIAHQDVREAVKEALNSLLEKE